MGKARYFLGIGIALAAVPVIGLVVVAYQAQRLISSASTPQPAVFAAASLHRALEGLEPMPSYAFAGSETLQRQIERGAPADVFASAAPQQAQALYREGRCSRPVVFATNDLVLLVPAAHAATKVRSVGDLRRAGLRIALGAADVPAGAYARQVLARLRLTAVLRRDRVSEEPDVDGVVAKVALGSADAGFAYRTDALATRGRTRVVPLPDRARPRVRYEACLVRRDGARVAAGRRFLRELTGPDGRRALRSHGFGLPPRGA